MKKGKDHQPSLYTTLDAYQAGFLITRGHRPALIDQGSKVAFGFVASDTLYDDLADYTNGAIIEASRFASTIKQLKSQIFSRRDKDGFKVKNKQER